MDKPVIVDTCALFYRRILVIAFRERIIKSRRVVVPRSISREAGRLRNSPMPDKRGVGLQAAVTLMELHCLPGLKVMMDGQEPITDDTDTDLLTLAETMQGQILTEDAELQQRARVKGIDIISIQELSSRLRLLAAELNDIFPPYRNLKSGDLLTIQIDRLGQRLGQGIGYLDDGRMVVVEEGASYLGGELEVRVRNILQPSPGAELIFAVPAVQTAAEQLS
jgi:uncharacterized protein YacL